jgi:hypothetical protein
VRTLREGTSHRWLSASALALVLVAGALCLAMPFWGDQALFTLYARQLTEGAVLYRDVFDVKQPGVFLFYAVGGWLFGFTEVGIHVFELVYWLGFSIFALTVLQPYFTTRWSGPLVAVFTVVVYYCYAQVMDLTQLEILVAFPLLLAWWLIDQADPKTARGLKQYAAAGLLAAAVVLLKHLYIVIVLAFLVYSLHRSRRGGTSFGDINRGIGVFFTALVIPLLVVVGYFAVYGQLGRIWWAYFDLAPHAQLIGTKSFIDLKLGARRFMIGHAPILILAVLGCVHGLRRRVQVDLIAGMLTWIVLGAVAFLIQGWWEYKWLLFTVPLGILAVTGIETIVAHGGCEIKRRIGLFVGGTTLAILSGVISASDQRMQTRLLWSVVIGICAGLGAELLARGIQRGMLRALLVALSVSIGLAAIWPVHKLRALMEHDFTLTAEARTEFQRSWSEFYESTDEDLTIMATRMRPGPLHVFGDPVLLFRANRAPAIPFLGLRPEFYDDRAWRELDAALRSTPPPNIVVDRYIGEVIRRLNPGIMDSVESRYQVVFRGAAGTWYVLR